MDQQRLYELADKWKTGTITETELAELNQSYQSKATDASEVILPENFADDQIVHKKRIWSAVEDKVGVTNSDIDTDEDYSVAPSIVRKTTWLRYAAAVILVAGGSWLLVKHWPANNNKQTAVKEILPGSNKAILTVGDKTIDLSSEKAGVTVGETITYNDGSSVEGLAHHASLNAQNTIRTPRGGQYQIVLPDGSKVWLNSASSIRFPAAFKGGDRRVDVTGEVYMEVARNSKQPFYVHSKNITIQVLGTSFNINAYENEDAERTTLIEGSVRIINDKLTNGQQPTGNKKRPSDIILKPGQQAIVDNNAQISTNEADIDKTLAWKNGFFNFENADLKAVMRQLERWYDIDVVYEKGTPEIQFMGEMSRNVNLSDLLNALKRSGVNFKVDGKKLIVMQ